MATKRHITIEIKADFGSGFQEQVFSKALQMTLLALKISAEGHHKKNKIVYYINSQKNTPTANKGV